MENSNDVQNTTNEVLADVSNSTSIDTVVSMLDEIKKFEDLRKFQLENVDNFCNKHNIKQGQLNFLISVVAAERVKESGMFG